MPIQRQTIQYVTVNTDKVIHVTGKTLKNSQVNVHHELQKINELRMQSTHTSHLLFSEDQKQ